MTSELQRVIDTTQAKADAAKMAAESLIIVVQRMRVLAEKDEWDMSEEIEWAEMEKQVGVAWMRWGAK